MTMFLLALTFTSSQAINPCDLTRLMRPPCLGVPVTLWICGPPATGPLTHAIAVDGILQPSPGLLVRYGYDVNGHHLEVPDDVSQGGSVQYVTPGQIVLWTPGPHTVTVTYGAGQAVAFPLLGATSVISPTQIDPATGNLMVSACPSVARVR
jgi:hypothetical protein